MVVKLTTVCCAIVLDKLLSHLKGHDYRITKHYDETHYVPKNPPGMRGVDEAPGKRLFLLYFDELRLL